MFAAHSQASAGRFERVDRGFTGLMRGARDAELLLVPEVDPCLVPDLDRGGDAAEDFASRLDDRVLGLPGQVRRVEVAEVVVQDPGLGRLAGDPVPDGLVEAPGEQVPAREVQAGGQSSTRIRVVLARSVARK